MMKKKTVRLISCVIAGILIVAMLFSMFASSLTFAAAAEDDTDADSLRDQLSSCLLYTSSAVIDGIHQLVDIHPFQCRKGYPDILLGKHLAKYLQI